MSTLATPAQPTPRPGEGVISWDINTACNYRCRYCNPRFQ